MTVRRRLHGSMRQRLVPALVSMVMLTGVLVVGQQTAYAATDTVGVNLAISNGVPQHVGSGWLYGLSQFGQGPIDSLLQPLVPTSFRGGGTLLPGNGWIGDGYRAGTGYTTRMTSALAQARRVTNSPYAASYDLLVSDVFGADTSQPSNTVYPCTAGDCRNWISFIDRVVADVAASGVTVRYDIWNEPDYGIFWPPGMNTTQYFAMWDAAVYELQRLQPAALIVGPSEGAFKTGDLTTFLNHAKTASSLPNLLNWHFSGDPLFDANAARSLLASLGITGLGLSMNEYMLSQDQNPARTAWTLGQIAYSGIQQATHAIWTCGCYDGSLDQILTGTNHTTTSGQYWTYERYAELTGTLVQTTSGSSINAAAARNSTLKRAEVFLGTNPAFTGTATININNIASAAPYLVVGGAVHVTVERIPDQANLSAPLVIASSNQTLTGGNLTVTVPWSNATDMYNIVLTPP